MSVCFGFVDLSFHWNDEEIIRMPDNWYVRCNHYLEQNLNMRNDIESIFICHCFCLWGKFQETVFKYVEKDKWIKNRRQNFIKIGFCISNERRERIWIQNGKGMWLQSTRNPIQFLRLCFSSLCWLCKERKKKKKHWAKWPEMFMPSFDFSNFMLNKNRTLF